MMSFPLPAREPGEVLNAFGHRRVQQVATPYHIDIASVNRRPRPVFENGQPRRGEENGASGLASDSQELNPLMNKVVAPDFVKNFSNGG